METEVANGGRPEGLFITDELDSLKGITIKQWEEIFPKVSESDFKLKLPIITGTKGNEELKN